MTRPGRPATSASSVTPRVSFSLGADEYGDLCRVALERGQSPGQTAKRLTLSALDAEAARQAEASDPPTYEGGMDFGGNERSVVSCPKCGWSLDISHMNWDTAQKYARAHAWDCARQAFVPDHGPCVECKAHGVVRQATGFERGIPVCGEHS
jgi:hypothetical protein